MVTAADRSSLASRLSAALPAHFQKDKPFRDADRTLVRSYAGKTTYPEYTQGESFDALNRAKEILPNTFQACEAYVMNLAASRPRFLVTSPFAQYQSFAAKTGRALDRYARELYLEEILQSIARNSYFSVGVAKVFQASSAAVGMEADYRMDPGRPFVQSVSIRRLVRDTAAESPEEASFIGDLYEIPYELAIKKGRFPKWARDEIKKLGPANRINSEDENESHEPRVDDVLYLCDVFIRSRKAVWTFVCDQQFNFMIPDPIQRVRWLGEECGPYYVLNMGPAPGHFFPVSPGQIGMLLNNFENSLFRKLEDQAMRMKLIGTADSDEDAVMARDAQDGEYKRFQNPGAVGMVRMDGPDQTLFGLYKDVHQRYSAANNNLDMKLALGQQADTASQERMLGAAASRVEAFYQERWLAFVRRVSRGLARLIWSDSELKIPGNYQIPGTPIAVNDDWEPGKEENSRMGSYDLYAVDVDPYSMPYQSPGQRAAFIDQHVTKWMPYAPFLGEMGIQIDPVAYFEIMSNYGNAPELRTVFKANQPPLSAEGPSHNRVLDSSSTREYIHRSAGSGNKTEDPMQYFAAGNQQEAVS